MTPTQIPPWPGCVVVRVAAPRFISEAVDPDFLVGRQYRVSEVTDTAVRCYGESYRLGSLDFAVDLSDDDTFRGAVARLAERLGAPPEAVSVGVTFECYFRGWMVTAGGIDFSAEDYAWSRSGSLPPANHGAEPAEALAAAWAQVLAEVKP